MTVFKTKGFYFKSKNGKGANKHLYCTLNDDNETITVKNLDGETPKSAGALIMTRGSVHGFLKDCEPTSANFTQWQRWIKDKLEKPTTAKKVFTPKVITTTEKVYSTSEGFLVDDIPPPVYSKSKRRID